MANRKKTVILSVALTALFLVVSGILLYLNRPRSIEADSKMLTSAFARGDADALYNSASDQEIATNDDLTRAEYRTLFRELIWPRLEGFSKRQPVLSEVLGGGGSAASYIQASSTDNRAHEFSLVVHASPDGPKTTLLTPLLSAWRAEYLAKSGLPLTPENMAAAYLKGYRKDRPVLESLGIRGVYNVFFDGPKFSTWEELEKKWEAQAAGQS